MLFQLQLNSVQVFGEELFNRFLRKRPAADSLQESSKFTKVVLSPNIDKHHKTGGEAKGNFCTQILLIDCRERQKRGRRREQWTRTIVENCGYQYLNKPYSIIHTTSF